MSLGILIYDITNKRLFSKIYKIMESYHTRRIQKSVFEIDEDNNRIIELIDRICGIIDMKADKLSFIPLCEDDESQIIDIGILSDRESMNRRYLIL